jgi:hypothetical protein
MDLSSVLTTKFILVFGFGAIIIYLYGKDKFNVPTYDKDIVGPFSQVPPQFLTLDARYRVGWRTYLFLMIAVYTAMSLVGPNIISVDPTIKNFIPKDFQEAKELWPIAAATFLIYTGAARDTSVVGRIELTIRQYAQKKAYIPDAVFGLAASLRNLDIKRWLSTDPAPSDKVERSDRHKALEKLITRECLDKLDKDQGQEGELATWVRANILFYAFETLFQDRLDVVDVKMDQIVQSAENKAVRERLQKERTRLAGLFTCSEEKSGPDAEKAFADIQRFLRDLSLALAIFMSQAARNTRDLVERLDRLGFEVDQDHGRSDHNLFVAGVIVAIFFGALLSVIVLGASQIKWWHDKVGYEDIPFLNGIITVAVTVAIYVIAFRAIDYQRDKLIDSSDWSENLEGYAQTVVPASVVASAICLVSLILVYFGLNSVLNITDISYLFGTNSIAGLIEQGLRQFLLAFLAGAFFVRYMRDIARLPQSETGLRYQLLSPSPLVHAITAATLVAGFAYFADVYTLHDTPKKYHFSASTSLVKLEKPMREKDEKLWFSGRYEEKTVKSIDDKMNDIGHSWSVPDPPPDIPSSERANKRRELALEFLEEKVKAVKDICVILDKPKAEGSSARPAFRNPETCEWKVPPARKPSDSLPADLEIEFDGFTAMLGDLYKSLDRLKMYYTAGLSNRHFAVWIFPALVVFVITYAFGIGSRFWRTWLLYKDVDRENSPIRKFKDQLQQVHRGKVDAGCCLITPLAALDFLTPLEAVRYPDYRAKLFAKVQKQRIQWPNECEIAKPDTKSSVSSELQDDDASYSEMADDSPGAPRLTLHPDDDKPVDEKSI